MDHKTALNIYFTKHSQHLGNTYAKILTLPTAHTGNIRPTNTLSRNLNTYSEDFSLQPSTPTLISIHNPPANSIKATETPSMHQKEHNNQQTTTEDMETDCNVANTIYIYHNRPTI